MEIATDPSDRFHLIEKKLDSILGLLESRPATMTLPEVAPRSFYKVEEVAKILDRTPYSVREWCRHGRIHAKKQSASFRGAERWQIAAEELNRYRNFGLLPIDASRNAG